MMFEQLRYNLKHNRKTVMRRVTAWLIFGFIILVMGFWGINKNGQTQGMGQGTAATVNGHSIPMARLQEALERLRRDPQMQQYEAMGGEFGQKMMQSQALSQIVQMELIRQKAEKEHIITSDAQVRDTLLQIPAFQDKGQFKREYYNNYLAQSGKSSSELESELRQESTIHDTAELFRAALAPTTVESELTKNLNDKKADVEFVKVPNDALVTAEMIKPAQIKDYLAKPENQKKVSEYFDSHKKDYAQQEQVRARHILIKAVAGDKDSENKAFSKAQDLEKQIKAGSDFAALAKKNSDDPGSKEKGGDLGFFAKGSMVAAFEKAAFDSKPGTVTEPIKTEFGYHIIKVEEKKPAETKTFDQVKDQIAAQIISREQSHDLVANLEKSLKSPEAATAVGKMVSEHKLKWEDSGAFSLSAESIPKVGDSDEAVRTAFSLTPEKPYADHLIRQGPTAYVIRYKTVAPEKKKAGPSPEDSPELIAAYQANRRSQDALRGWVEALKKNSKIVTTDGVSAGGPSPFDDN